MREFALNVRDTALLLCVIVLMVPLAIWEEAHRA